MFNKKATPHVTERRPHWREYQARLQKSPLIAKGRLVIAIFLGVMVLLGLYVGFSFSAHTPTSDIETVHVEKEAAAAHPYISKRDVQLLLEGLDLNTLGAEQVVLPIKGHTFHLETSLDADVQSYLLEKLDRKNSHFIGIVIMDAESGRILSLTGFNKSDTSENPCLRNTFPAASIFKMVTAAAAIDLCGYTPNSRLKFNGYKHTLYKRQLTDQVNKYTNTVTFKDSFAQSVNPVFGKLGTLKLGREVLEEYATAFGFNQPIDFELPVSPSRIRIADDPYNWAEIASGFNNDTTISPLHGAMMATAVVNRGMMKAPTIVTSLSDENGTVLYRSQPVWHGRAMTSGASSQLLRMMETTITSGTSRKAFRGYQRHRILSKLRIGGKTGSIYNRGHELRFDWFVGFAQKKKDSADPIAVAVLVAHEEFIGIRASAYARMAMTRYYEKRLN